jgi:hypothetical protein
VKITAICDDSLEAVFADHPAPDTPGLEEALVRVIETYVMNAVHTKIFPAILDECSGDINRWDAICKAHADSVGLAPPPPLMNPS